MFLSEQKERRSILGVEWGMGGKEGGETGWDVK